MILNEIGLVITITFEFSLRHDLIFCLKHFLSSKWTSLNSVISSITWSSLKCSSNFQLSLRSELLISLDFTRYEIRLIITIPFKFSIRKYLVFCLKYFLSSYRNTFAGIVSSIAWSSLESSTYFQLSLWSELRISLDFTFICCIFLTFYFEIRKKEMNF